MLKQLSESAAKPVRAQVVQLCKGNSFGALRLGEWNSIIDTTRISKSVSHSSKQIFTAIPRALVTLEHDAQYRVLYHSINVHL